MRAVVSVLVLVTFSFCLGCGSQSATTSQTPPPPASSERSIAGSPGEIFLHPIADTELVVDDVLKSMGLVLVAREDTATGRYIEARRADNAPVFVHLVRLEAGTDVRVRVGLNGDEAYSRKVLDAVRGRFSKES
jgi:hypothetical protein